MEEDTEGNIQQDCRNNLHTEHIKYSGGEVGQRHDEGKREHPSIQTIVSTGVVLLEDGTRPSGHDDHNSSGRKVCAQSEAKDDIYEITDARLRSSTGTVGIEASHSLSTANDASDGCSDSKKTDANA